MTHQTTGLVWQRSVPRGEFTWPAALGYCDELNLAGTSDWRLPTLSELESIIDLGATRPAINPDAFPDTPAEAFWSLSVDSQGRPSALDFGSGAWSKLDTKTPPRVRCVRQGRPATSGDRFLLSDQTVIDRTSGLTWQRVVTARESSAAAADRFWDRDPGYFPFLEAEEYCRQLEFAGSSSWRLPTLKELMSLLEPEAPFGRPTIDPTAFPATPATPFWSSTPAVQAPGHHWIISFFYGTAWPNKAAQVRCVR